MTFKEPLDRPGDQKTPRASDGVGIKRLNRCPACQRIWLQDGPNSALELSPDRLQTLAHELQADLNHLPQATCRLCLYRAGYGATEIDEYGQGKGFGFSWEYVQPEPLHAMLTILSLPWLQRQHQAAILPNVVTHPQTMRAVLSWFVELLPPSRVVPLPGEMLTLLAQRNSPGCHQPGTQGWTWKGWQCLVNCPPLHGPAQLVAVIAGPARDKPSFAEVFPVWQALAHVTLLGAVAEEQRPPLL